MRGKRTKILFSIGHGELMFVDNHYVLVINNDDTIEEQGIFVGDTMSDLYKNFFEFLEIKCNLIPVDRR